MAQQEKVNLNGGPDIPGGDTLYQGFVKLNDNMDLLAGAPDATDSGAAAIGYFESGVGATTVQAYLDGFTYDATNGITTGRNVGTGDNEIYKTKVDNFLEFKTISGGTNVSLSEADDVITINAGLANSYNVTVLTDTDTGYTVLDGDEIILIDTGDQPFELTLPTGSNKRILNIKNLAWSGSPSSATQNSTEVTITAASGEYVEDDRTGIPVASTAIGPGSSMRIVYSTTVVAWSII